MIGMKQIGGKGGITCRALRQAELPVDVETHWELRLTLGDLW